MEKHVFTHHSDCLNRDMTYAVYGFSGKPVIAFPSQNGHWGDFEAFGMVDSVAAWINDGTVRLICPDSIDSETWSAAEERRRAPRECIEWQERWYHYIVDELRASVVCSADHILVTGCSMGAVHAGIFFFRRPDLFDTIVAFSGLYGADYFFHDYTDELVYANSPLDFIPNMPVDHPWLDLYRRDTIILCVGQGAWEEPLLASTRCMDALLKRRGVNAWVDYWGYDVNHDWCWWRRQLFYFFTHLFGER